MKWYHYPINYLALLLLLLFLLLAHIGLAIMVSIYALWLIGQKLVLQLKYRLRMLLNRRLKMPIKLALSSLILLLIVIPLMLSLSGCATEKVAAECPKLPAVSKEMMKPPANQAELAKILNSTPMH